MALDMLVDCADPSERDFSVLVAKVRRLDYSIADLFGELTCLAEALEEVLQGVDRRPVELRRFLGRVRHQVRLLFAAVLDQTAAVYEAVTENTGCGYCQLDDDGVIVFGNAEMTRLLDAVAEGVVLPKLFGDEGAFVLSAIRGDYGPNPGLRRLKLRRPDNSTIAVNISPAPLFIHGAKSGGYAILADVSKIIESDRRIFDQQPLGIVRYDLTQQITYANLKAGEILGRDATQLPGTPILALVPDAKNRDIVQSHFKKRMEGVSDEYELRVTRLDDGCSVPVRIAGSTEFDNQDRPVGGFVIFRSVELEHTVEAIHQEIEMSRDARRLLRAVAEIIGNAVPFDELSVSVFSKDMRHAAALYIHGDDERWQTRWYPISEGLAKWMMQPPNPQAVDDLREFVERPEMDELRNGRDLQTAIDDGFRSFIRYSIVREGKVAACFSVCSKTVGAYGEEHCRLLKALPIEKAVSTALYHRDRQEQEFRHDLLRRLACCRTSRDIALRLVKALAKHYGWQNVAIFEIDKTKRQFTVKAQKAKGKNPYRLPRGFTQPLESGVLGHVYQTGEAVNIGDVGAGQGVAARFIRFNNKTTSELCLPIRADHQVRWLLNVEDGKENAFSAEEQAAIEDIITDVEFVLEHLFTSYALDEVFTKANDLIVLTDHEGRIVRSNPTTERLLGVTEGALQGRTFREFFADPAVADYVDGQAAVTEVEVDLLDCARQPVKVLLSGRLLPGELDRKVFFAQDLSVLRRLEELETIGAMFQEIAVQTRTPLALVSGFLRRIHQKLPAPMTEGLAKAITHLRKVEVTHERLLLLSRDDSPPRDGCVVNMQQLIDGVLAELTEEEQKTIEIVSSDRIPRVNADYYDMWFVVVSLLSYLLRYLPVGEKIKMNLRSDDDAVDLRIAGFVPTTAPAASGTSSEGHEARTRAEIALGESIIRRFVGHHGGSYSQVAGADAAREFRIRLPASP
jgi:PAS domain S-box-containing protein